LAEARAEETSRVAAFHSDVITGMDLRRIGLNLREDLLAEALRSWRRSKMSEEEVERRRTQLEQLLAGTNFTNPAIQGLQRNIFDRALKGIDEKFAAQPLLRARLLQHMATTLREMTLVDAATAPQIEALETRKRLVPDDPLTVRSMYEMGQLLGAKGKMGGC
jgi:hypothetical protein